jgi:uncharacterized iron-regulated membrane protein
MKLKQSTLRIHYYAGLTVAVLVVLQAITGVAISWRWDLAQIISPSAMTGTSGLAPMGLESLLATAGEQLPRTSAIRIFFPHADDGVYFLQLATEEGVRYASVDPSGGRVLKFGDVWAFPVEAALRLHSQPLSGRPGHILVLAIGLLLTVLGVTGLLYWWPGNGNWRSRIAVNFRQPFKFVVRSLHRATGICLLPLALMMAITGMILAGELIVTAASAGSVDRYDPVGDEKIDEIVHLARAHFPEARVRDIRLMNGGPATVQLWQPGTERWSLQRVVIDRARDQVIDVIPAADNGALWMKLLPFHTGSIVGVTGRVITTMTGIGLLLLATLGLVLWLTKRRRTR